jgi:Kef-type K+ transport system membrane component KefB
VHRRLGGATQIAVRLSFAVMVGFAALAQVFGPEAILGAFLAGVAVSAISDRTAGTGATRDKLEVVGFGLLAPMFFVAAGLRFDLGALSGDGLVLVPLLLVAMLLTRALPSLLFLRLLTRREVAASALLMSTKLTFVVAAVQIGLARDGLRPATASALITAAILTVLVLPGAAALALRPQAGPRRPGAAPEPVPRGTAGPPNR